MIDLLIVTAPFTYTFGPSLAPALLKSCVTAQGLVAKTWDISAEFNLHANSPHYQSVKAWMISPELTLTQEEYNWYQLLVCGYAEKIFQHYCPKNLAISLLTMYSHRFAEDLCFYVRLRCTDIKILLGGSGLDILQYQYQVPWHDLLLNSGLCDTVILGEGEFALGHAIINNQGGLITVPQLTDAELDQVPVPNYDDYDFSLYQEYTKSYWVTIDNTKEKNELIFLITASKGCVKNCSFCDVGKIWKKFRHRSASKVAEEIISLHQKYGATYFSFTDSLMNGGMKVFYELNKILTEQLPRTISYEGQIICRGPQDMPEKYFEIMAQAGCRNVTVGMESGSEQVRIHMGKGSSQNNVHHTAEMLIKYGINQSWNIIAGYPTETSKDWNDTMDLIKYWLPRSNGLLRISPVNTFLLLDGTPMTDTDEYLELGLQKSTINGYSGFAWTSDANPENTFDQRCARFLELCHYLLEFDPIRYARVREKIKTINKQLEWYHSEYKPKKIFDISAA
jgi:radical SAM superfamily enzyme YgiQ (UPF0313 family)